MQRERSTGAAPARAQACILWAERDPLIMAAVPFAAVQGAGTVAAARRARVTILPTDYILATSPCLAVTCLRAIRRQPARRRIAGAYVAPWLRGAGIGSALVRAALRAAVAQGARVVDAYTYRTALYARLGFQPRRHCGPTGSTWMVLDLERDRARIPPDLLAGLTPREDSGTARDGAP